jgi:hypothetical protein
MDQVRPGGAHIPDALTGGGVGRPGPPEASVNDQKQPSGTNTTMVWVWFVVTALILGLVGAIAFYIALP